MLDRATTLVERSRSARGMAGALRGATALVMMLMAVMIVPGRALGQVWTNVARDGGAIGKVVISPHNTDHLYAITDAGAVYHSTNRGELWREIAADLPGQTQTLMLHPTASGRLYSGTSDTGVFRSDNGGGTWTPARAGLDVSASGVYPSVIDMAAHPTSPSTIYAATSAGVFVSWDGGGVWTLTGLSGSISALAVSPAVPAAIYALKQGHVYRSDEFGTAWTAVEIGLPTSPGLTMLAVDPVTPTTVYVGSSGATLYRTTDGAATWSTFATPATFGTGSMRAFAISPSDPATITVLLLGGGNVKRTTDGGSTWVQARAGLPFVELVNIAIDPSASSRMYIATGNGVFGTTDSGAIWSTKSSGLTAESARDLSPDVSSTGMVGVALRYGAGLLVTDAVDPWIDLMAPSNSGSVGTLAFAPRVAGAPSIVYLDSGCSGLRRTTYPGGTWVTMSEGLSGASRCVNAIVPRRGMASDVFVATANGVFYSSGFGSFVSRSVGLPPAASVSSLARGAGEPGVLYAVVEGVVYVSADDGMHWIPGGAGIPTGPGKRVWTTSAAPGRLGVVFAATSRDGVYRSIDGGATWVAANAGLPRVSDSGPFRDVSALLAVSELELYAAVLGGVYASLDGGTSWNPYGTGLPAASYASALGKLASGPLVAATERGTYTTAPRVAADGLVIYENFTSDAEVAAIPACGFNPTLSMTPKGECAVGFTAPADLALDHIDIAASASAGSNIVITLRADASGLPGEPIETMAVAAGGSELRVMSSTRPHLEAGHKYWVSLTSSNGVGNWLRTTRQLFGRAFYREADGTWVFVAAGAMPAIRVIGRRTSGITALSHSSWAAPAGGGSQAIVVHTSSESVVWTATSSASWLSVSPAGGIGNGTVTISVLPASGTAGVQSTGLQSAAAVDLMPGGAAVNVTQATPAGLRTATVLFMPRADTGMHTRYLPEGATSSFFDTRLALLNPAATPTTATLSFLPANGVTVVHAVAVPAQTRVTVSPKSIPGLEAAEFSTVVTSDLPLVVDRTMTWGAEGYGAHAETAVAAPWTTWYFAEGATHSGFDLFYLLQNPATTTARVRVRYLRGGRHTPRKDIRAAADLPNHHLGRIARSSQTPDARWQAQT